MKNIKRIIVSIITITVILTSLGTNKVLALSQQEVGYAVVNAATRYMDTYGSETRYTVGISNGYFSEAASARGQTMFGQNKSNYRGMGEYYWLDCASFVILTFMRGINIQSICDWTITGSYVGLAPNSSMTDEADPPFQRVDGDVNNMQAGDIIFNTHHVMLYMGNGNIMHCDGGGGADGGIAKGAISLESIDNYARRYGEDPYSYHVYRISEDGASQTDSEDITPPPIDHIIEIVNKWRYTKVPFRKVPESSIEKDKNFSYQGIAKEEPKSANNDQNKDSSNQDNSNGWAFSKLSDLLNVLANIIATPIKGVLVGFTTTVQALLSASVCAAAGQDTSEWLKDGIMPFFEKMASGEIKDAALSMGKIVYNQVPLLDTNVFNGNVAGGQTLNSSSIVITIRNLVATIYMAIRKVAIIGLLLVLIYLGIKLAITSSAEEKAECKQKIQGWFIAFFIVFGMHYFLVFIMQINEIIVGVLRSIGEGIANTYRGTNVRLNTSNEKTNISNRFS